MAFTIESADGKRFFLWNAIFLGTGIVQTLMAYEFVVMGFGARGWNIVNAAGNPLGQALVSAVQPTLWRGLRSPSSHGCLIYLIAFSEIGGNTFTQIAISLIGSGLHSVIYSSVVVLNALFGIILFRKELSRTRWSALVLITTSVALASLGQPLTQDSGAWWATCFGMGCSIMATVCFSLTYVLSNHVLSPTAAIEGDMRRAVPMVVALKLGLIESCIMGLYFGAYVVPRWNELIVQPMGPTPASALECVGWYIVYLLVCALHQYGFYYCVSFSDLAAVTSGVNKSIQAAVLFFASSSLFCHIAPVQCITSFKVLATIGVCVGVLVYASEDLARTRKPVEDEKAAEMTQPQKVS